VIPPPNPPPPTEEELCWALGGVWNYEQQFCEYLNCPLILDVDGNGYHLTNEEHGVWFDLDTDGVPEHIAWTAAESDDAFLVMDRNGNGRIDDGAELFGNHTPAYAATVEPTPSDGFAALSFLERPDFGGGTADLRIDASDAAFSRLMLWTDWNHNGLSEPDEFRLRAKAFWRTESGALTPRYVYDVWLKNR